MCVFSFFFSLFLSMLVLLLFLVVRVSQTGEILILVSFPGRFYVSLVDSARDGDFAVDFSAVSMANFRSFCCK